MARAPNCNCHCECCPDGPIVLDTWIGSRAGIPTDLTTFPAWNLNHKDRAGLLWAISCTGTGGMASGTPFCVEQNFEFFSCLPTTPMDFGIAKTPACSGSPLAIDLMPLAMGTLFEGKIRERNDHQARRILQLRARLGSGACVDFGFPNNHGAVIASSQVNTVDDCPWELDVVDVGNLKYSLVVLCVCCTESLSGTWWGWRENPLTFNPTTHDSLHRDARCCVEGVSELRPAACAPDIVLFDGGIRDSNTFDSPNLDVDGLRALYGSAASFWGTWPVAAPAPGNDPYDLTRTKMIWLGAFTGLQCTFPFTANTAQQSFPSGSLDVFKDWLALGEKLLVLDWGRFNDGFLAELGIDCQVEEASNPTTIPSLNWRKSPYALPVFCGTTPTIAPQPHILTTGITDSLVAFLTAGSGALTESLTYVPVVTPSVNGIVLGRCQGDLQLDSDCESVDYPAIVLEPYPANPTSHVLIAPVTSFYVAPGTNLDPWLHYADGFSRMGNSDFLRNLQTFSGDL